MEFSLKQVFKVCFLGLLVFFILFSREGLVFAQTVSSNQVITKVGDAPEDQKPQVSPSSGTTQPEGGGPRPPAPPVSGDLRQAIIDKFGITLNGFGPTQLQWAWEKFWDVSNTNFINLTRGTVVTAAAGTTSEQTGCKNVLVGSAFSDPTLFKIVLTHELGHIIYWCNDDSLNKRSEQGNAFSQEGGVTGYGDSGCLGTPARTEDYAEMIAYYLNRDIKEQTARCNNRGQVPFANGKSPLHFAIARSILGEY